MSAHLHTLLVLALLVSGCGFSGALYLPEEEPPASGEQPAPGGAADQAEASPV